MSFVIFNKELRPANSPCVRHNDRGLTLGHGLFETILINKNSYPALDYHWARLVKSLDLLGLDLCLSKHELKEMLNELIKKAKIESKFGVARLTITAGEAERGLLPAKFKPNFLLTVLEYQPLTTKTFCAVIVKHRKNEFSLCSKIKSLSYLDNILAKKEAQEQGFDEAILANTSSFIAEASNANIFMVKNGQIITPKITDGALPGVVREIILKELSLKFSLSEASISIDDLMLADEIFLTNALIGVKALTKLNHQTLKEGPVASKVRKLLQAKAYII